MSCGGIRLHSIPVASRCLFFKYVQGSVICCVAWGWQKIKDLYLNRRIKNADIDGFMADAATKFNNRTRRLLNNIGPRGVETRILRNIRDRDRLSFSEGDEFIRQKDFYMTDGGLKDYNVRFGVDMANVVIKLLRTKRSINVLDLGAGQGIFGVDLQNMFGSNRVYLHAVGLLRPYAYKDGRMEVLGKALGRVTKEPHMYFKSYHLGDFRFHIQRWFKDGMFDLIVAKSLRLVTQNQLPGILSKLRPDGGMAFMQVTCNEQSVQQTLRELQKKGIYSEKPGRDEFGATLIRIRP